MARAVRSATRVDTMLLVACGALALLVSVLPLEVRGAIAGALRRSVMTPLVALQQQSERARGALLSRDETMHRIDSLALRTVQLERLDQENAQLRRLLGLGREVGWGFVMADAIHGRVVGETETTLTLTAGAGAGVQRYAPVVTPDGLVGQVRTVDPTTSVAITWTHPDFGVSAMSADGGVVGIVKAHLRDWPERFLLEMQGVAFRSQLPAGTVIVSAGLGGVYPRGITIGTVLSELATQEGWARTYLLRPAVRPSDASNVMILLPPRVAQPLDGVWTTLPAADSAARAVAAAGDSIRRDSLALVARRVAADSARRAVADSIRRAAAADTIASDSTARPAAGNATTSDSTPRLAAGNATTSDSTPRLAAGRNPS